MISAYLLGPVNTGPTGLEEMAHLLNKREARELESWCQTITSQRMDGKRHIPSQASAPCVVTHASCASAASACGSHNVISMAR